MCERERGKEKAKGKERVSLVWEGLAREQLAMRGHNGGDTSLDKPEGRPGRARGGRVQRCVRVDVQREARVRMGREWGALEGNEEREEGMGNGERVWRA